MGVSLSAGFLATLVAMVAVFLVLSFRIVYLRTVHEVGIEHGNVEPLRRAVRVHGNFSEWVPLALVALLVADLQGVPDWGIAGLGGLLVVGRLSHAVALTRSTGGSVARTAGVASTVTVLVTASVWACLV